MVRLRPLAVGELDRRERRVLGGGILQHDGGSSGWRGMPVSMVKSYPKARQVLAFLVEIDEIGRILRNIIYIYEIYCHQ
jgi:hypothetical protein